MYRFLLSAIAAFATASPAFSQALRTSAPISDVRYEITADSASVGRRQLGVTMSFRVNGTTPVVLALPAWSPGHYVLIWFARRVSQFSVEEDGAAIAWQKLDYQTWQIVPRSAGTVRVSFRYLADAVDRAVAWTAPNFAFFNGTNLFLYPVGRGFNWPAQVTVRTEPSWGIATGMDLAPGVNSFRADNYHDLTDHPFYVGRFAMDSTLIGGKWVRIAFYPAASLTPARRDRTFGWLQKIFPAHTAVFGEAPFRNYTLFQRSDTVVNGGGLEHQSSQVDEVLTSELDAGYLPGLYSHEAFHAWNVKRLRPADMVPYRYDDAQPTTWLWVSEGVTDYYGELGTIRGGITDSTAFFNSIGGFIAQTANAPPTAVSDASLSPWVAPTDGSGGLYYPKGGLIGFLLDIIIRNGSDNHASLDHVMRALYNETYKRGRGFTGAEWWREVGRAAGGKSFTDFARRYVDGREPLPTDSVMRLAGLQSRSEIIRALRLGISTATDTSGVAVTEISPGGAAAASGIRVGDYIISIGDVAITDEESFGTLRERYAGTALTTLPLVVRRGTEIVTLALPVRLFSRTITRVSPIPGASEKAVRIRNGIMKGTTS